MTALAKYASRLAAWFALAYLGYWCALVADRAFVQSAIHAAVRAPTLDWTITPYWVSVVAPGAFPDQDRKSTRLNSSHIQKSRMPSSA